ncbi:hypothetical protein HD554DRAFT_2034487 [Boletus coccyginus]|nr:hypothetical protein HD554DRAFT_2042785 [Boletus coccyginus]KAI9574361.1 hypothetical protein HD554DRAFT_2034487 [Boletus coccyginus]
MHPKENHLLLSLNPSDNACKTTGFLQRSRWLQVVSSHFIQDLLSLVAVPAHGDILSPTMPAIKIMFKWMWDDIESMEVLPQRHIHTPKGNLDTPELENKPPGALRSKNTCFNVQNTGASIAILEAHAHMLADLSIIFMEYYSNDLLSILKESYLIHFNALQQLIHLVSMYAFNSTKLPNMHWNQGQDTLSVKGLPLWIDLLPKMVQALCFKAKSILNQLLLEVNRKPFNLIIDTALKSSDPLKWPVDPLHNTNNGFSFVHSSHNSFHVFLDFVFKHIHSNSSVFDYFHFWDAQGCLVHKHVVIWAYLHLYHEFVHLHMVLVHTSTPSVAQDTELGPL